MDGTVRRVLRLSGAPRAYVRSKQAIHGIGTAAALAIFLAGCTGSASAEPTATTEPAGPATEAAALDAVQTYLRTTEYESGNSCLSAIQARSPEWRTSQVNPGEFHVMVSVESRAFGKSVLSWTVFAIDGYVDPGQSPC